jgi:putative ABC transport system permease protein
MSMPVIVTLTGAVLGNIAGYTAFKNVVVELYYNSYSLPQYETVWSSAALVKTTIIPLLLMFFINLLVISRKLRLSPLRFLRHDLKKTKRTKAVRLPAWSFLRRFRLRVMLQNIPDYIILILGIILIEVMLCFAFGFQNSLSHYSEQAPDMLFTRNQYMLTGMKDDDGNVITTETEGAEKFASSTLVQDKLSGGFSMRGVGGGSGENVTVYGYEKGSRYIGINTDMDDGEVYISSAYSDKYSYDVGDRLTLGEKYEKKTYEFTVAGIFDYMGGVSVFMPRENYNRIFDRDEDYFNGFFSDEEIKDIDNKYIAVVMTRRDIMKITDQLMHSMGGFMKLFKGILFILSVILIYLLTKIIIEKNENSISMTKILGFKNSEIASLYMMPTAITVMISTLVSLVAGYYIMKALFRVFMESMDGWFTFYMGPVAMVLSVVFVLMGYTVVSVVDFIRIRRIPMDEALKNVE